MTRRALLLALPGLPLVGPALAKLAPAPPEITTLAAATARNAQKASRYYSPPLVEHSPASDALSKAIEDARPEFHKLLNGF